mgnify:CR=1 FL=1
MLFLVFLFAIISLLLAVMLIRYHAAVRDVAQQVRQKRRLGSCSRLAPSAHTACPSWNRACFLSTTPSARARAATAWAA